MEDENIPPEGVPIVVRILGVDVPARLIRIEDGRPRFVSVIRDWTADEKAAHLAGAEQN